MFDFDWPVDQAGYEWADDAGAGWVLRRRGGPNKFYRPLEDYPGLFRRFASLTFPEKKDEVLEFTNNFGFIYGSDNDKLFLFDRFSDYLRRMKIVVGIFENKGAERAAMSFNSLLYPYLNCKIWLDIRKIPPERQLRPANLYGAMIIQASQQFAGTSKFRKCRQCEDWFSLGKRKATARREFCSDRCRVASHRQRQQGDAT